MNPSRIPGALPLAIIMLLAAGTVLPSPGARADVEIVTAVGLMNNTMAVDLVIDGNVARVNVTRDYVLAEGKGVDEVYDTGLFAPGSQKTDAALDAPAWGNMSYSGTGFNITFNTSPEGNTKVAVKYGYSLLFPNVGALNFSRSIRCQDEMHVMFTWMTLSISDLTFILRSNVPVSVFDGEQTKNGTDLMFNYSVNDTFPWFHPSPPSVNVYHLVSWNGGSPAARVNETINTRLAPERHTLMENLIRSESVSITIGPGASGYSYFLHGEFQLNNSVLNEFGTVWLWFPNNMTAARAWICNTACEVEQSVRDGQKGFYILVEPQGAIWSQLVVDIPGNMTGTWCDFFIVTVPIEDSSVRYILPNGSVLIGRSSPFELADFENTSEKCVLDFHGRCTDRGPVHVEWDPMTLLPCYLNVSVANITCESADISWETSDNPDFVKYQVLRADVRGQPGAVVAELGNQEKSRYTVRNLAPNTTSYLTVRKVMFPNRSIDSDQLAVLSAPDPPKPPKVSASRQMQNATVAAVSWTPSQSKDFSLYRIFASSGQGVLGVRMADITDPNASSCNITGLDPKITYYITVYVLTNHSGEARSEQAMVGPVIQRTLHGDDQYPGGAGSAAPGVAVLALLGMVALILLLLRTKK